MKRVLSIAVALVFVFCIFSNLEASPEKKEWTFMVFLNADNNLDAFGVGDLQQMVDGGGSNHYRNVVVLMDRFRAPTKLYYVEAEGARILEDRGDIDMGDYKVFVDFVVETAKAYPAKHYAVIIWNHGSGWKKLDEQDIIKGISYDETSGNHITTAEIKKAGEMIKKALGKRIDVFCFDACLMQMIEVAYNLKDSVDYLVASQEVEPGGGYPYDFIFKHFTEGTTPRELSEIIVREFARAFDGGSQGYHSTTQSALKAEKIDDVIDAINGFSKAAMSGNYQSEFRHALNNVQKFYYRTNIDLGHLVQLTNHLIDDQPFTNASNKLLEAIDNAVVANGLSGHNTRNATGIAIYFPFSVYSFSNNYQHLDFAQDTLWEQMVRDYYSKSAAARVVLEASSGDFSGLNELVASLDDLDPAIRKQISDRVAYSVFTENKFDDFTTESVSNLLLRLRGR